MLSLEACHNSQKTTLKIHPTAQEQKGSLMPSPGVSVMLNLPIQFIYFA